MTDIQNEYNAFLQKLEDVQIQAARLQRYIAGQGMDYREFEKQFIRTSLTDNIRKCAGFVREAEQIMRHSTDIEMKKLSLMHDYAEVKRQRDNLRSPGVHLAALLKKAGASGTDVITDRLVHGDAVTEMAAYNQKVEMLSESAVNPEIFRQAYELKRKERIGTGTVRIGSTITFGTYPQNEEGNDRTPIEWIVLDMEENRALLLSKYGLDSMPYNMGYGSNTWERCSMREWLNGEFLSRAFTSEQQKSILVSYISNARLEGYPEWHTSGGNDTRDRVFCLSYHEVNQYFDVTWENNKNSLARVAPTEYAKAQGAFTNKDYSTDEGKAAGWWWLRSAGLYQYHAAFVNDNGALSSNIVTYDSASIRPAFYLDLSRDFF